MTDSTYHRPDHTATHYTPPGGRLVHLPGRALYHMPDMCISEACRLATDHAITNYPALVVRAKSGQYEAYYVCRRCHRAWWCSWAASHVAGDWDFDDVPYSTVAHLFAEPRTRRRTR